MKLGNEQNTVSVVNPAEETKPEGFVFYDKNDNQIDISNYSDTPVALILWSSDTDYSFEAMELIEKVYESYKDSVTFLVINTEEKTSDIIQTIEDCGYSFEVYYDKDNLASEYYEYEKLPTMIFLEEDGTKFNQIEGEITEDTLLANLDVIAENY